MPVRAEIIKALDDFIANEGGMKFQHLAVALGRMRWPELIASERRADLGLDAYGSALLSPDGVGKGLASSTTPTLEKVSQDAEKATKHYTDLKSLIFVTSETITRKRQEPWVTEIRSKYGLELTVIEREDIITSLMMPEGVTLCRNFLHVDVATEPALTEEITGIKAAAAEIAVNLATRIKGPMIPLRAQRLEANGLETTDVFTVDDIRLALRQSRRIVLEAPAGQGKTTTLVQLARVVSDGQMPIFVDLPGWIASGRGILEFISGTPQFQARGLDAGVLARAQNAEQLWFLLNGWNEIAESNSDRAELMLRDLDLHFSGAGIIVATRAHHLTPPLPGAVRLRLLPLLRRERAAYVLARLGGRAPELRALLDARPVLDELTRTPFILSEVVSLFEAGMPIPDKKISVIGAVIALQESGEHRNALQAAPLFGCADDYLEALATEMTRRGAVSLPEEDARTIAVAVARELERRNQIAAVPQPAAVLAALTAHHVLERSEYPAVSFRFGHQQFQERYAALELFSGLLGLAEGGADDLQRYTANYVNEAVWTEPLHMVAERLGIAAGDAESDERCVRAGRQLVEMALAVDPVFAGELAQLCGAAVWREVGETVGTRLRALHAYGEAGFRQLAVAAMIATGSGDFQDILVPLLSSNDRDIRLGTYRLWPALSVTSLGPDWRRLVGAWPEDARADFVGETLRHRLDVEVAAFAVDDQSATVKKAAAVALMWTGSEEAAARVLASMDAKTFEEMARNHLDQIPSALKETAFTAVRRFIDETKDQLRRLRAALSLIEAGETGLDDIVKSALAALRPEDMRNAEWHYILPAVEHLHKTDPTWVSEWLAVQISEGALYHGADWLRFVTNVPEALVERLVQRFETEDLKHGRYAGILKVIAAGTTPKLAARVLERVRELRRTVDADPEAPHEFERAILRQLEALFRALPDHLAVKGILASIKGIGEAIDIRVATDLLSTVARSDLPPLHLADEGLKERLHAYLKASVELVLSQDDFDGEQKADLASSIAQLGHVEDMADIVKLIRADIDRVRRGQAARAEGDRGPRGNGGSMSQAPWLIAAVMQLDPVAAGQVLIDLLPDVEYTLPAAEEMARGFLPKPERAFDRTFRYELVWSAREGRLPIQDDNRRADYAAALKNEIGRLLEERRQTESPRRIDFIVVQLAKALAAIDGHASATIVFDAISLPAEWNEYHRVEAAERLLISGVVLPSAVALGIVDSIVARTEKYGMQDADKNLFQRALALCPFVDDSARGVAKMREALEKRRLVAYELREIVTALGESRSAAAAELLVELASNSQTFEHCEDNFVRAFAALDMPRTRDVLLGFVDPDVHGIALPSRLHHEDVLIARLTELAIREPKVAMRFRELCERADLPDFSRHILSKVMDSLGSSDALDASLSLMDDERGVIPQGIWDEIDSAFVERRAYGGKPGVFTQHGRASNELRGRLFKMVSQDPKRRKGAFTLLGHIEQRRLEDGRPSGEPRHPDFGSNAPWPPAEPA
jgi:hypothetical protein